MDVNLYVVVLYVVLQVYVLRLYIVFENIFNEIDNSYCNISI